MPFERAGLLRRERDGWYHHCHLEKRPLESAAAFLAKYRPFWEGTLDALAQYVEGAGANDELEHHARRER